MILDPILVNVHVTNLKRSLMSLCSHHRNINSSLLGTLLGGSSHESCWWVSSPQFFEWTTCPHIFIPLKSPGLVHPPTYDPWLVSHQVWIHPFILMVPMVSSCRRRCSLPPKKIRWDPPLCTGETLEAWRHEIRAVA